MGPDPLPCGLGVERVSRLSIPSEGGGMGVVHGAMGLSAPSCFSSFSRWQHIIWG